MTRLGGGWFWLAGSMVVVACGSRPTGHDGLGANGRGAAGAGGGLGSAGGVPGSGGEKVTGSGGETGAGGEMGTGAGGMGGSVQTGAGGGAPGDSAGGAPGNGTGGAPGTGGNGKGGSAGLGAGGAAGTGAGGGGGVRPPASACDAFPVPADHPNAATDYDITTAAGVVIDKVSGLTWERALSGPALGQLCGVRSSHCVDQNASVAFCAASVTGGFSNWRLPGLLELSSIIDFAAPPPFIDAATFPDTPATYFWTATPVAAATSQRWTVDFNAAGLLNGSPFAANPIRCVRTTSPIPCDASVARYQPASPGGTDAVLDRATTLVWQKAVPPGAFTWSEARAYCAALPGGFRLPRVKELLSILDFSRVTSPIDPTVFPDTPSANFWTATAVGATPAPGTVPAMAYVVTLAGSGGIGALEVARPNRARCVR